MFAQIAAKRTAIGGSAARANARSSFVRLRSRSLTRYTFATGRRTAYELGMRVRSHGLARRSRASFRHALDGAQARRAGAGVVGDLGEGGADRLLRDERDDASPRADADGERGRARAALGVLLESVLHDPVLERVVREDGETRAERETLDRVVEEALQVDELPVRRDAESLEDARRRVLLAEAFRTGRRDDDLAEPPRRRDRGRLSLLDDSPGDAMRHSLLPKFAEDPRQLVFVGRRHDFGGGLTLPAHPHVERSLTREREAAARLVEPHRRDAEARKDPPDPPDPQIVAVPRHVLLSALPPAEA